MDVWIERTLCCLTDEYCSALQTIPLIFKVFIALHAHPYVLEHNIFGSRHTSGVKLMMVASR